MATIGFGDLKDMTWPATWDLTELKRVQLADGSSFEAMVRDIQSGLTTLNRSLLTLPHYGAMFAVQTELELEYPVGVTNGIEEATEYSIPNPKRGALTGHMLPIKAYDRGLGWTIMYLRNARTAKLDADVRSAMIDMRDGFQKHLLTRFFKSTYDAVGTSGKSVPFADGGTADSTYVPPTAPDGGTFLYTHTHLLRYDTIANAINPAILHLVEHGHTSPFEDIGSRTDAATWKAVTGFKSPEWPGIAYMSSTTERAMIAEISDYYGYLETPYGICRLWLTPRVPTNYFGAFKQYGDGDPRNPLRIRINSNFGWGWQLVPGLYVNAPATMAVMYSEYGVGIGEDRTNGVLCYIYASGSYVDPTIT